MGLAYSGTMALSYEPMILKVYLDGHCICKSTNETVIIYIVLRGLKQFQRDWPLFYIFIYLYIILSGQKTIKGNDFF